MTRPHGLRGEVVVELWTNREERLAPGSSLDTDSGPLVVFTARKQSRGWVVAFEGTRTCEEAEKLRGLVLKAEALQDDQALWVHELVGCEVFEGHHGVESSEGIRPETANMSSEVGKGLGKVTAVQANPASDLLVLEGGGLVPLCFVTRLEYRRIYVDIPQGLLD